MSLPENINNDLQRLAVLLKQGQITQKEIADSTQVNQSQISRILSGSIKRVSTNVLSLCEFVQNLDPKISNNLSNRELISEAALQLWDGSSEQAIALQNFFNSLSVLKDTSRGVTDAKQHS